MKLNGKPPNFLIIMVDELRYPPVYESPELRAWVREHTPAQNALRRNGIELHRHYISSAACVPSRASIFTGQYPSLHGVSQTTGAAKQAYDSDVFWLDPNTVPTLGDYFRAVGYRTHYRGKWHVSDADIYTPGTHNAVETWEPVTKPDGTTAYVPIPANEALYQRADRLDSYGFTGWIGPEPHGSKPQNSGYIRDPGFARQSIETLDQLENEKDERPWLLVTSFVDPHDIVLFGLPWKAWGFPFQEGFVPEIPEPPTRHESLATKPRAQQSYVDVYPRMLIPQPTIELYRQFYYYIQTLVDQHIQSVFEKLRKSRFYRDTIVVFTSDHGDMLGAHGGMHQKWHNAYEETIHVPCVISNPELFQEPKSLDILTSHADLIPTLLGLAGADAEAARRRLAVDHSEAQPLVGRDLSRVLLGDEPPDAAREPVYFLTYDQVSRGQNQIGGYGVAYHSVIQPNNVETVVAELPGPKGPQVWKYSRYFDNPQFWTSPPSGQNAGYTSATLQKDELGKPRPVGTPDPVEPAGVTITRTERVPDETEMYNLTEDPLELRNLAHPDHVTPETRARESELDALLKAQCEKKRLQPWNGAVPGALSCAEV